MNKLTKLIAAIVTTLSMGLLFSATSFAQSYNQGTAKWSYQTDANCYQVYYKERGATNWQFSVPCSYLKGSVSSTLIKNLKVGVSYTYRVQEISNIANANQYRWLTPETKLPVTSQPQW